MISSILKTSGTGATSASITPTTGTLLLAVSSARLQGSTPSVPTMSGCSISWVQIKDNQWMSERRVTMFYGIASAPTTGTLNFSYTGGPNISFVVFELTGVDLTAPIVQSTTGSGNSPLTVTLGAFSNIENATVGAFGNSGSGSTCSAGSGYTLSQNGGPSNQVNGFMEFRADNETTVDATSAGNTLGGIVCEINSKYKSGFFNLF